MTARPLAARLVCALLAAVGACEAPARDHRLTLTPAEVARGETVALAVVAEAPVLTPDAHATVGGVAATLVAGDPRHAVLVVPVAADAALGPRTVLVEGSSGRAVGTLAVVAASSAPRVVGLAPDAGPPGETIAITLETTGTDFTAAAPPAVMLQAGAATAASVAVLAPTRLRATLTVPHAAPGAWPLLITSGPLLLGAVFTVGEETAAHAVLAPAAATRGAALTLAIEGTGTRFAAGVTRAIAEAGAGLTLGTVAVADETHAAVDLVIDPAAPLGPSAITLATGTEVLRAGFAVLAAPGIELDPASAVEGWSGTITVRGTATHFAAPATTAGVDGIELRIDALRVLGPELAELDLTLPRTLLPGAVTRELGLTTGWETARAAFTVLPAARVAFAPAEVPQGGTVRVTATGAFTHFVAGTTRVEAPPDAGLTVTGLTVTGPAEAVLDVAVDFAPPPGPRTLALVTGDEAVAADLTITAGPPAVGASPTAAGQGARVTVALEARNVGLGPGTAFAWLPGDAEVQTLAVSIADDAHATLDLTVAPTALVRSVLLRVTTPTAQVDVPFGIEPGGLQPALAVTPAAVPQGETTHVVVTGAAAHFDARTALALPLASGIVATAVTVTGPTRLEADLVVPETTPPGDVQVTATTAGEVATATLAVTPGAPRLSLLPAALVQGAGPRTVTATAHFFPLEAGTTFALDPACDVSLQSATVTSATSATLALTIPRLARPGPCTVTATTAAGSAAGTLEITSGPTVAVPADAAVTITAAAPTAYVAFTATSGALVYARARRALGTQLDPYLTLIDRDRHTVLATNDQENAATLDALILYRIPAEGTYYFAVRDRLGVSTGGITVALRRFAPETTGETEPNDDPAGAQVLDLAAGPVLMRGDLVGADTRDCYRLLVAAGYHFAADVVAREASPYPGSAAAVTLTLHLGDGTMLTSSERGYGPDPVIHHEPAADAELLLEVQRSDTDPAGGFYFLNLRPAVVVNEVFAYPGDPSAAFIEVVGPPLAPLAGYALQVGGATYDLSAATTSGTGFAVLAHDALVPQATLVDPALVIPGTGAIVLLRAGTRIDTLTYDHSSLGRGFRLDTGADADGVRQAGGSPGEANLSELP
jgi:hypothetical protein